MSYIQNSLRPYNKRNPQPPIRTPRGNFRYSAWIAQASELQPLFGSKEPTFELVPATFSADYYELIGVRLFLFGSDNIARAQARTWRDAFADVEIDRSKNEIRPITSLAEYTSASTTIVPASLAAAGGSVYATVNGVPNVRGIVAEFTVFFVDDFYQSPLTFEVDATFDSGVIAGTSHFSDGAAYSRPVILPATQFNAGIVSNKYTVSDDFGNTGTVVGVFETFVPSYYYSGS